MRSNRRRTEPALALDKPRKSVAVSRVICSTVPCSGFGSPCSWLHWLYPWRCPASLVASIDVSTSPVAVPLPSYHHLWLPTANAHSLPPCLACLLACLPPCPLGARNPVCVCVCTVRAGFSSAADTWPIAAVPTICGCVDIRRLATFTLGQGADAENVADEFHAYPSSEGSLDWPCKGPVLHNPKRMLDYLVERFCPCWADEASVKSSGITYTLTSEPRAWGSPVYTIPPRLSDLTLTI